MQRVFDFLRTDDIPRMARANYGIELRHLMLWGVVVGAIEGNIAGVVASKTFGASKLLTSIIWATPIFANTLNLLWGIIIRGRRRVPAFRALVACAVVCVASVALNPAGWEWGGWLFAAQLGLTHVLLSGLLTLRAAIWNANYPHTHRARITARMQTLRLFVVLAAGASIAVLFDRSAAYYRFVYPAVAGIGLISLIPLRRWRVRGEPLELRRYRERRSGAGGDVGGLWNGLREAGAILRDDAGFRRFMVAQSFLGSANFFTEPMLLIVLTEQLRWSYLHSTLLMYQIPVILMLATIGLWARYFDRVGVVRFRVLNSGLWIGAYSCITLSMYIIGTQRTLVWLAIGLLVLARLINGICRGGGAIAWNIGHLHFAREHQSELYMGIHVALTGLRGLVVPLLATLAHDAIGNTSFAIAIGISLVGHLLFRRLARKDRLQAEDAETPARRQDSPAGGSGAG